MKDILVAARKIDEYLRSVGFNAFSQDEMESMLCCEIWPELDADIDLDALEHPQSVPAGLEGLSEFTAAARSSECLGSP